MLGFGLVVTGSSSSLAGAAGIVFIAAAVYALWYATVRLGLTAAEYRAGGLEPIVGAWGWLRPVLPRGTWQPEGVAAACGPLISGAAGPGAAAWLHAALLMVSVGASAVSGVAAAVDDAFACGLLLGVLGTVLLGVGAALSLAQHSFRTPHEGVLRPLQFVLLSVLCLLKAFQADVPAWLKLLQSLCIALGPLLRIVIAALAVRRSRLVELDDAASCELTLLSPSVAEEGVLISAVFNAPGYAEAPCALEMDGGGEEGYEFGALSENGNFTEDVRRPLVESEAMSAGEKLCSTDDSLLMAIGTTA